MTEKLHARYLRNARAFNQALFHARQSLATHSRYQMIKRRLDLLEGYMSYRLDQIEFWCGLAEIPLLGGLCHRPISNHERELQKTISLLEHLAERHLASATTEQ